MGMDQRFYTVERKAGNPRHGPTILLTLLFEFRGQEVYHAIADVMGYGLNGSYLPLGPDDLDAVIKTLHSDDDVVGPFGWAAAVELIRDVRKHVTDEQDYVLYEWDN